MSHKISIITVSYNACSTIEQTLTSSIDQTYRNKEIIVIDGGSDDGTVEIIKKHQQHLAYWVSESDDGIYDGMNKGIAHATGDWIIFMNSGDLFYNNSVLSNIFEQPNLECDVLYGNRISVFSFGKYIHIPAPLETFNKDFPLFHQASFVRTNLLKQRGFNTSYKICADYESFFYMWDKKFKFVYNPVLIAICECETGFSSKMSNQIKRIQENEQIVGNKKYSIRYIVQVCKTICRVMIYSCCDLICHSLYISFYKWRCSRNSRMSKYLGE